MRTHYLLLMLLTVFLYLYDRMTCQINRTNKAGYPQDNPPVAVHISVECAVIVSNLGIPPVPPMHVLQEPPLFQGLTSDFPIFQGVGQGDACRARPLRSR